MFNCGEEVQYRLAAPSVCEQVQILNRSLPPTVTRRTPAHRIFCCTRHRVLTVLHLY